MWHFILAIIYLKSSFYGGFYKTINYFSILDNHDNRGLQNHSIFPEMTQRGNKGWYGKEFLHGWVYRHAQVQRDGRITTLYSLGGICGTSLHSYYSKSHKTPSLELGTPFSQTCAGYYLGGSSRATYCDSQWKFWTKELLERSSIMDTSHFMWPCETTKLGSGIIIFITFVWRGILTYMSAWSARNSFLSW